MKVKLLFISLILISSLITAQTYPEVTIRDINFVSDSLLLFYGALNTEPPPPLLGDTVTVVGVVMNPPYEGADPDSIRSLHAGAPSIYLQDTAMTEWSGVLTRFPDPATPAWENLDSGLVVKVTGVVVEFQTTTELDLFDFQAQDIIGSMPRPEPVLLTLDSLVEIGTPNPNYLAEKWEAVYVEFHDVTVIGPAIGNQSFYIQDDNGSRMIVYTKADWWRRKPSIPPGGTHIDMVRGYIETRSNIGPDWFLINPVFEEDIEFGEVQPPVISTVNRDKGIVNYGDEVDVSAQVNAGTGTIEDVQLVFSINGGTVQEFEMIASPGDSVYVATIPAQNDSSLVWYYVRATDNFGTAVYLPADTLEDKYFYWVLDRPLTIQDVQNSPFGGGRSAYHEFEVTVRGIVTADTTDLEGDGNLTGPQVYIQNGTGQWSGINLFGTEALSLNRGEDVSVTGIVDENFSLTRIEDIDDPAQITVHGTITVPDPLVISTEDMGFYTDGTLPAESYESVLVKYENLTVANENADGNPGPNGGGNSNFGEIIVYDQSNIQTRIELQDGTHDYHNYWDSSQVNLPNRVSNGNTFEAMVGIMGYTFSRFKLLPRKNDDFIGHVTEVEELTQLPKTFSLSQNYPNPFNPSTTIEYALSEPALVKIKIFNVLGEEVKTLVNKYQNNGNYRVSFNASHLSTGIYFYRIDAGNYNAVKKMIMLK